MRRPARFTGALIAAVGAYFVGCWAARAARFLTGYGDTMPTITSPQRGTQTPADPYS